MTDAKRKKAEVEMRSLEQKMALIARRAIREQVKEIADAVKADGIAAVLYAGVAGGSTLDLLTRMAPVTVSAMCRAMLDEAAEFQIETRRHNRNSKAAGSLRPFLPFTSKASTASEWLLEEADDIEPLLIHTPYGDVLVGLRTEYPDWIKASVQDRLTETYAQPYWDSITQTTGGDIEGLLREGLEDGWSIEKMAEEMNARYGDAYAKSRGRLIARTEAANALNGARVAAIDTLVQEMGEAGSTIRKLWLSVLGSTTRDTHANLDGVPAGRDGRWYLGGVRCRWPGDIMLPVSERANCQCTVVTHFGMQDAIAEELIAEHELTTKAYEETFWEKAAAPAAKPASSNSGANCGIGPGGFQPGNTCAKGGGGKSKAELKAEYSFGYAKHQSVEEHFQVRFGGGLSKFVPAVGMLSGVGHPQETLGKECWQIETRDDLYVAANLEAAWAVGKFDPSAGGHIDAKKHPFAAKVFAALLKKHTEIESAVGDDADEDDDAAWTQVGGKLGTVDGGVYEYKGQKYYVKFPKDPVVAEKEVTALKLYKLAGASAVDGQLVTIGGKKGVATKWEEGTTKLDPNDEVQKRQAVEDYAIHAWLNNRDAVGAGSENPMDNIRIKADGKPVLVDAGASLDVKGTGGVKSFGKDAPEFKGMLDPSINPTMAKVFGGMTESQLAASVAKLSQVSDKMIRMSIHDKVAPSLSADDRKSLQDTLIERKYAIIEQMSKISIAKVQGMGATGLPKLAPEPQSQPSTPAKPSKPPAPSKPIGVVLAIPAPPSVGPKDVQAKMTALYEASKLGQAQVEAISTNPNAQSPYPKKLHAYKMEILKAMASQKEGGAKTEGEVDPKKPEAKPKPIPPVIQKPIPPVKKKAEAPAPVETKGKGVVDVSKLPKLSVPDFMTKHLSLPEIQALTEKYVKLETTVKELAARGDLEALDGLLSKTPPGIQREHVHAVIDVVATQLHPPPPSTTLGTDWAAATSHVGPRGGKIRVAEAKASSSSLGFWATVGKAATEVPYGETQSEWSKPSSTFWEKGAAKIPAEKRKVLKSYTGEGYHDINEELRVNGGAAKTAKAKKANLAASTIMEHGTTLPVGLKLSRKHSGVSVVAWTSVKPGTVISERGILSTSSNPKVWAGDTHFHLTVGPGVRGVPARLLSQHQSEAEVLLPPNQRIMITKIKREAGVTEVHAIILPTLETQCCPA